MIGTSGSSAGYLCRIRIESTARATITMPITPVTARWLNSMTDSRTDAGRKLP